MVATLLPSSSPESTFSKGLEELQERISSPVRGSASEMSTAESEVSLIEVIRRETRESTESRESEEENDDPIDKTISSTAMSNCQYDLQETFRLEILPFLNEFVKRAKKQDLVFHLFSNMLDDLLPYIYG